MLITTGKKPDALTRKIALALFLAVPGARLENRGKRTLQTLASIAEKRRHGILCSIHGPEGKCRAIAFFAISDGKARRIPLLISVKSAAAREALGRCQAESLEITGSKSTLLSRVFNACGAEEGSGAIATMKANASKIAIHIGRKKILEMGVSYEK